MVWDKKSLNGKVTVKDIKETAQELVPKMRKEGADVIVAIAHSGLPVDPYKEDAENSAYYLTQVQGVDAIVFGHAHAVFPSKEFAYLDVRFETSPSNKAAKFIQANAQYPMKKVATDDVGFAVYQLQLNK